MTTNLEAHVAADLFPMIDDARLEELVASMRARGFDREKPIVLFEGKILDGRNRYRASQIAGVEPSFVSAPSDCDPFEESWKHNGLRRDLSEGQRVAICHLKNMGSSEWHAEQKKLRDEANMKRSEAAAAQHAVSNPRAGERLPPSAPEQRQSPAPRSAPVASRPMAVVSGSTSRDVAPKARENVADRALAKQAGVSEATASRLASVGRAKPELIQKIAAGEVKLAEAVRQVKREAVSTCAAWPTDKYRVIYADPPWKYGDERGGLVGYEGTAAADHYPTMATEDICALDVRSLGMDDAVLFCWATFPLLPDALRVVQAWGFKYKTAFVWSKGRGAFGHYHRADAELLIIAVRGSCQPESRELQQQVQELKRDGKHSAKPEHFRHLIDLLYPSGPRIELFRRGEAPKGWTVWGNEAAA